MTPEFIRKAQEGLMVKRVNAQTSSTRDESNESAKFYKEQLKNKRHDKKGCVYLSSRECNGFVLGVGCSRRPIKLYHLW